MTRRHVAVAGLGGRVHCPLAMCFAPAHVSHYMGAYTLSSRARLIGRGLWPNAKLAVRPKSLALQCTDFKAPQGTEQL